MSKHTPGPWIHEEDNGAEAELPEAFAISDGMTLVAVVHCTSNNEHHDKAEANARLIAAAPELLKALKELTPPLPRKDAICHNGLVAQEDCRHCQQILRAHAAIAKAEDH